MFAAQSLFRGLYLPPGRHEVELNYSPQTFRTGLLTSALGALLLLIARFGPWAKPSSRFRS